MEVALGDIQEKTIIMTILMHTKMAMAITQMVNKMVMAIGIVMAMVVEMAHNNGRHACDGNCGGTFNLTVKNFYMSILNLF